MKRARLILASFGAAALVAVVAGAGWVWSLGPAPHGQNLEMSQAVLDRDGRLLRAYATKDGRWRLPATLDDVDPRFVKLLLAYGTFAVAGAQFCYFSAVQHMQVGPAILMEFTAPAVVVVYLWLRHGQRPSRMTLGGAALAALGLVLVLDLVSGADLSLPGVLWALAAMGGCATYFIISADEANGLPPLVPKLPSQRALL